MVRLFATCGPNRTSYHSLGEFLPTPEEASVVESCVTLFAWNGSDPKPAPSLYSLDSGRYEYKVPILFTSVAALLLLGPVGG